jgi:hypothetical protein
LIAVEIAPDVSAALRAMKDRGGSPPDSVLTALVISKPASVELDVVSEYLGVGETQACYRY